MSSIREHLESPQFPDEAPPTEEDLARPGFSLLKFSGGWVAAGEPRKKAYAIYLTSIVGGALLMVPGPGQLDLFAVVGLGFLAFGIFGTAETFRGKRFPRP